jgi:hypothetical protein
VLYLFTIEVSSSWDIVRQCAHRLLSAKLVTQFGEAAPASVALLFSVITLPLWRALADTFLTRYRGRLSDT